MKLGAQTHFAQYWSTKYLQRAADIGVSNIRDEQYWDQVETTAGVYTFPAHLTNYMSMAANLNIEPLITLSFANSLYDGGNTPHTDAGRQAYKNYCLAVINQYGSQIKAVEIWNEYNGSFATGPATADRPFYYTEMLKVVYTAIKAVRPDITVVGGGMISIPYGFFKKMFDYGALDYMDALSFHPYHPYPEQIPLEIADLKALIATYGKSTPLWATEFGSHALDGNLQAGYLIKTATLLAASGVEYASWYLLINDSSFPTMGLLNGDDTGTVKPSAAAFQLFDNTLSPLGIPTKVAFANPHVFAYRYAANKHVVWGNGEGCEFSGNFTITDSMGVALPSVTTLTTDPVVVTGDFNLSVRSTNILADSRLDYGSSRWTFHTRSLDQVAPMQSVYDDWGKRWVSATHPFTYITQTDGHPGHNGSNGIFVVRRYTAPKDVLVKIQAQWKLQTSWGNGVETTIHHNGQNILSHLVTTSELLYNAPTMTVSMVAGDTLDFGLGPNGPIDYDATEMYVVLSEVDTDSDIKVLREKMPVGVPSGISAQDIHDLITVFQKRTTSTILQKTSGYTATEADNRSILAFDTAVPVTLGFLGSLQPGWSCKVVQKGEGQVSFSPGEGGVVLGKASHTKTSVRYGWVDVMVAENNAGVLSIYIRGDTAA